MAQSRRLIGLDPGLRHLGWGVIEVNANKLSHIADGSVVSMPDDSLAERLVQLETALEAVFATYRPEQAAVENTFVNRDGAATLKLGQARAVCLLVPARRGLPIAEYAPNFIKRAVTGAGHADKHQIKAMVKTLLPAANPKNEHAADALAVAIAHAHAGDLDGRVAAAVEKTANINTAKQKPRKLRIKS